MTDHLSQMAERETATKVPQIEPHKLDVLATRAARSAALVFAERGWTWAESWTNREQDYVPDALALGMTIRRLLNDCEIDRSRSTGRIYVSRWIEDGREHANVSLDLGAVEGEEAPGV